MPALPLRAEVWLRREPRDLCVRQQLHLRTMQVQTRRAARLTGQVARSLAPRNQAGSPFRTSQRWFPGAEALFRGVLCAVSAATDNRPFDQPRLRTLADAQKSSRKPQMK
jgi:hypothetical protein